MSQVDTQSECSCRMDELHLRREELLLAAYDFAGATGADGTVRYRLLHRLIQAADDYREAILRVVP